GRDIKPAALFECPSCDFIHQGAADPAARALGAHGEQRDEIAQQNLRLDHDDAIHVAPLSDHGNTARARPARQPRAQRLFGIAGGSPGLDADNPARLASGEARVSPAGPHALSSNPAAAPTAAREMRPEARAAPRPTRSENRGPATAE